LPFQGGAIGLGGAAAKVLQEICRHGNIIEARAIGYTFMNCRVLFRIAMPETK
jgi:hypothetical protein